MIFPPYIAQPCKLPCCRPLSSSVPRYNNYANNNVATVNNIKIANTTTSASSTTSPNNAKQLQQQQHLRHLNSFKQQDLDSDNEDDRDRDNDLDLDQKNLSMYQITTNDNDNACNNLIPPRPPDVQATNSNELSKRLTSYEMIPLIKPSSSMPNSLPNSRYSLARDSKIGDQDMSSDDCLLNEFHGSQPNIVVPQQPPYRSHSRSTSKSYNISNSNLTMTSTNLASSTLSNLSNQSGAMGSATRRSTGGGYGLNSYGSNSNNGSGTGPLGGSRYNRTQNIEPRTTPYYYHELMQKTQIFDSNLNLLNDNKSDTTTTNTTTTTATTTPSRQSSNRNRLSDESRRRPQSSSIQYLNSLNGSLDNVLEATRRNLDDLILGNSLLYNSHSSNDLLNMTNKDMNGKNDGNGSGGGGGSTATLVDDQQLHQKQSHHSSVYHGNNNTNSTTPSLQNPKPAARTRSISNSSSSAATATHMKQRVGSVHSLHSSNSNILNNSNNNNNNSNLNNHYHHHMNHQNEKYVA